MGITHWLLQPVVTAKHYRAPWRSIDKTHSALKTNCPVQECHKTTRSNRPSEAPIFTSDHKNHLTLLVQKKILFVGCWRLPKSVKMAGPIGRTGPREGRLFLFFPRCANVLEGVPTAHTFGRRSVGRHTLLRKSAAPHCSHWFRSPSQGSDSVATTFSRSTPE